MWGNQTIRLLCVLFFSVSISFAVWAEEPTNYFLLQPGNSWTYQVTSNEQNITEEVNVTGVPSTNPNLEMEFHIFVNGKETQKELFQATSDGIIAFQKVVSNYRLFYEPEQMYLKYPVIFGQPYYIKKQVHICRK